MLKLGAIAAGVLALLCGLWYVDHAHMARDVAKAQTATSNLKIAIASASLSAQTKADAARKKTETQWQEKLHNAETNWNADAQAREAKLRKSLAVLDSRLRDAAATDRVSATDAVPNDTTVAAPGRLDAAVQLPGSVGLDLRYYAATAQQAADALKLCQQSYPSN
jgi:hypothetical protein